MENDVKKEMTDEELEREFLAAAKEAADATAAWKSADERVATANWNWGILGNKLQPLHNRKWMAFLKANQIPQRTIYRAMQTARLPLSIVVKWGVVKSEWVVAQFEKGAVIDDAAASVFASKYDSFMAEKALKVEQAAPETNTSAAARKSGKREMDKGQKAREAKHKELAKQGASGAYKANVIKLGTDGEQLAGNGAAIPRLLHQPDKEDEVTAAFIKSTRAMKDFCGWMELIDVLAAQATNEEIESAIERLGKVVHPAM